MIRIGICDDEAFQVQAIKLACEEFFKSTALIYEYKIFSSGEELLSYDGEEIHLLFLDIELGGLDGITVMKKVESYNNIWRIVFISSHEEAVWDSFGIKTLGFERKPITAKGVSKYINIVLKEYENNQIIIFDKLDATTYVKAAALLYLEAEGNYVRVHTNSNSFLVSGNLKKWENELKDTNLIRIHKSFLVNLENVKKVDKEVVLYGCNFMIPIGRKYKKNIIDMYNSFLIKKLKARTE